MSSYVEQNLGPNEKVVMQAKLNKLSIIPSIIGIVVGLIFLILEAVVSFVLIISFSSVSNIAVPLSVAMILFIPITIIILGITIGNVVRILSFFNTELVVTNKRVLGKVGVFSIRALDYPIEKVDNISLNATFFGKIFHYYNLSVKSAADSTIVNGKVVSGGIIFGGVENAIEFKNCVTLAIEQHADEARKLQAEEIARAMAKNQ